MKLFLIAGLLLLGCFPVLGQSSFDRKNVDVGNIGFSVTNAGTVGNPAITSSTNLIPSMEYPLSSGIEHLFEGGCWIGARVNGQTAVSTAAIDASTGYTTGASGYEMTAAVGNTIAQRSSLSSSDYYAPQAVSHQDFLIDFTDANTVVPGTITPIQDHTIPLDATVHLETYAWNYSFADYFVLLNYSVTNNSANVWDSVYMGMYTDMVVRNLNVCTDNGAAFFNKGGGGFLDSLYAAYAFDVTGDPGYTNSYGASQFLGIEWRGMFYHPHNAATFLAAGLPAPQVMGNFWNWKTFDGTQYGSPSNDVERYYKMGHGLDFTNPGTVSYLQNPGNRAQLVSAGPLVSVMPGETFHYVIAFVGAHQQPTGGSTGQTMDTYAAQTELRQHLNWAKRTYEGEDTNENGVLDAGEDLNGDGILEHYLLPSPPNNPKVRIVTTGNTADIYWDRGAEETVDPISRKKDFEGYRIYRSNPGDEFGTDLLSAAQLNAQWDKSGDSIGYDNGFAGIRMPAPLYFEGDSVAYYYHYKVNNLLNGWQYLFIITAFDEGDPTLNLEPLESSHTEDAFRVFCGNSSSAYEKGDTLEPSVYPNPYRISAAWDGSTSQGRKLYFTHLPAQCVITVYTLSGDVVAVLNHDAATYSGDDIKWFRQFAGDAGSRIFSGGEHAWDLLSESRQDITGGIYLFSVKDLQTGVTRQGRFAVIK